MSQMTVDNTLLLIIDIQSKLVRAMPQPKNYIENVLFLLKGLEDFPIKKIVTEQYPKGLGPTIEELSPFLKDAYVYPKTRFNACIKEVLNHLNDSIQHVVIIGMETSICIEQTAHQLLEDYPHLKVHLIRDAVTARSLKEHEWALSQLQTDGVSLISSETFLYRLISDAKNPSFKTIAQLVKNRGK
ncbi:isochorismatase family protein [Atopobacter sp. AH10]|uniref:isochorismatase family protein n=1 Tax=Atopobacter sp. AH10 TaxID=2315861 RepID=UPI000EF21ACE|nr:isochorismatase family protein [Atopobacter sp. AH10]RLK63699.1 isochorismatase family protein [Atopobacter sp. AH10]